MITGPDTTEEGRHHEADLEYLDCDGLEYPEIELPPDALSEHITLPDDKDPGKSDSFSSFSAAYTHSPSLYQIQTTQAFPAREIQQHGHSSLGKPSSFTTLMLDVRLE